MREEVSIFYIIDCIPFASLCQIFSLFFCTLSLCSSPNRFLDLISPPPSIYVFFNMTSFFKTVLFYFLFYFVKFSVSSFCFSLLIIFPSIFTVFQALSSLPTPAYPTFTLQLLPVLWILLLLFFSMRRWRFSSRLLASSTSWCCRHLWKFSTTTPTNMLRTKKLTISKKEMKQSSIHGLLLVIGYRTQGNVTLKKGRQKQENINNPRVSSKYLLPATSEQPHFDLNKQKNAMNGKFKALFTDVLKP